MESGVRTSFVVVLFSRNSNRTEILFCRYKTDFTFVIILSTCRGRVFDKNKYSFVIVLSYCKERPKTLNKFGSTCSFLRKIFQRLTSVASRSETEANAILLARAKPYRPTLLKSGDNRYRWVASLMRTMPVVMLRGARILVFPSLSIGHRFCGTQSDRNTVEAWTFGSDKLTLISCKCSKLVASCHRHHLMDPSHLEGLVNPMMIGFLLPIAITEGIFCTLQLLLLWAFPIRICWYRPLGCLGKRLCTVVTITCSVNWEFVLNTQLGSIQRIGESFTADHRNQHCQL